MKKVFCLPCLLFLLAAFCPDAAARSEERVRVGEVPPLPSQVPISVRVLSGSPGERSYLPVRRIFRCTNRTGRPVPLVLTVTLKRGYINEAGEIRSSVVVPEHATREFPVLCPAFGRSMFARGLTSRAESPEGLDIDFSDASYSGPVTSNVSGLLSPGFRPEISSYLLPEKEGWRRAAMPVRDWPAESSAYAGLDMIYLESTDVLSPELERALRLAAARGTEIRTVVLGSAPWPAWAGKETPGRPYEEKIGFGRWRVFRSKATDDNPAWKSFNRRKHELSKKHGEHHRSFKEWRWGERFWYDAGGVSFRDQVMQGDFSGTEVKGKVPVSLSPEGLLPDMSVRIPLKPVPLGALTLVMLFFVILIGPVNFMVLRKHHREMWCLATIPVLAVFFSGIVILCVVLGEGFTSRGQGRVMTFLDQRKSLAVSRGVFGIYSPFSLKKFRFDREDLLYFREFGRIEGDAGEDMVFSRRLLPSRMRFIGGVERAEFRSEKIALSEKEGRLEAVNGLGVPVESLLVGGPGKRYYKLTSVLAPGARAGLVPVTPGKDGRAEDPKTKQRVSLDEGRYLAWVSKPLFIGPGMIPDQYDHAQLIRGVWR